jgi:uncharacterized protein
LPYPALNEFFGGLVNFLFVDKSRTLFAFMFGMSFYIQLKSAERHQRPFSKPFFRRLTVLMLFGLLHAHLLFGADILRYYAAGGLFLLIVYKWPPKALLITGLLLTVGVPVLTSLVTNIYKINLFAGFPPMQTVHDGFMSASFWENVRINHETAIWRYWPFFLLYFAIPAIGIFLFGIWMGRRNYLQNPEKHRRLMKQMIGWGLGLGFMIQLVNLLLNGGLESGSIAGSPSLFLVKEFIVSLSVLMIALGYVCILALLCLRPGWNRFFSILAPAGRMTLTNYIMQSVLIWIIFNGSCFGLYMKIGPAITFFIAIALCALQLICSYYWLQYFKMGPLEWVWRFAATGQKPQFKMPNYSL